MVMMMTVALCALIDMLRCLQMLCSAVAPGHARRCIYIYIYVYIYMYIRMCIYVRTGLAEPGQLMPETTPTILSI